MKYTYTFYMEDPDKPIGTFTFKEPVNIGDRVSIPVVIGVIETRSGYATPKVVGKTFLPKGCKPPVAIKLKMS